MSDSNQNITINLSGKPKQTISDVFLKWVVNGGRIIIVVTELLALGALFYRFTIDGKIIDLHDHIKQAEFAVKNRAEEEKKYRSIQDRLSNIKSTQDETKTKVDILNDILKSISEGTFSATNLIVNKNIITINASAYSVFPVNNFIENLKQNPNVTAISIDEISSGDKGVQFKINIELKKTVTKTTKT
ncbi:MAG: hypothetical protein COX79_00870 [Candidatus Levybacteria bacterium CG_4_10_14_0_2_um_filter_36_16]|nr:MAG: hypothetical protein AUK12_04465 [Candidatus Levybacteria bacterium CG2_30_37_29]PIZ97790.1 MAG: hypothetical protein COX79_00870 [Candidatus Levybacteria bacterium CG_4_10_14_0_2_um_filter_36_16]PJA90047.1 MAG: hypothetical protein CO136_03345 [Candidatus Levybacteria bacterium CG_4_9_14_3_um_filter_36_7]